MKKNLSPDPKKVIKVGIAGNPNCGKTTIFNNLTGSHQHVGNWPGVTVEKKTGVVTWRGYEISFVDLPGTYSLSARSIEEIVARSFILNEGPDLILNVIDASNLERNLLLTTQLIELGAKMIIGLNMMDVARERSISIRTDVLSDLLGGPVVEMVGRQGIGTEALLDSIVDATEKTDKTLKHIHINYGRELEETILRLTELIRSSPKIFAYTYECDFTSEARPVSKFPLRWFCTRLLAGDARVLEFVRYNAVNAEEFEIEIQRLNKELEEKTRVSADIWITDRIYSFIRGLMRESVDFSRMELSTVSDRFDDFLLNRVLGIPIFLFVVWAMFELTFTGGEYLMPAIEWIFDVLKNGALKIVPKGLLRELVVNGIIDGVGNVMIFVPNIAILFFCIALLEDTGYMARAAFLMDRFMHFAGLHGKSFIALFTGFGCNAPAVMACRTLENRSDRLITMLITPLMSCTARFPVYVLFAGTFFPNHAGSVIFLIYLTGIVLAVLLANIFRATLFKGDNAPFVLELPPYRLPILTSLLRNTWEKIWVFVQKAGTVIMVGVVLVWFITAFPRNVVLTGQYEAELHNVKDGKNAQISLLAKRHQDALQKLQASYNHPLIPFDKSRECLETVEFYIAEQKRIQKNAAQALRAIHKRQRTELLSLRYAGQLGKFIEPMLTPLGFDWRLGVSLIPGFVAKEVVVGSFAVLYLGENLEDEEEERERLSDALKNSGDFTPLIALSFMLFTLLYIPCTATVSVIRKESGSYGWAFFSIFYSLVLAWSVSFVVYQGGLLLGY